MSHTGTAFCNDEGRLKNVFHKVVCCFILGRNKIYSLFYKNANFSLMSRRAVGRERVCQPEALFEAGRDDLSGGRYKHTHGLGFFRRGREYFFMGTWVKNAFRGGDVFGCVAWVEGGIQQIYSQIQITSWDFLKRTFSWTFKFFELF